MRLQVTILALLSFRASLEYVQGQNLTRYECAGLCNAFAADLEVDVSKASLPAAMNTTSPDGLIQYQINLGIRDDKKKNLTEYPQPQENDTNGASSEQQVVNDLSSTEFYPDSNFHTSEHQLPRVRRDAVLEGTTFSKDECSKKCGQYNVLIKLHHNFTQQRNIPVFWGINIKSECIIVEFDTQNGTSKHKMFARIQATEKTPEHSTTKEEKVDEMIAKINENRCKFNESYKHVNANMSRMIAESEFSCDLYIRNINNNYDEISKIKQEIENLQQELKNKSKTNEHFDSLMREYQEFMNVFNKNGSTLIGNMTEYKEKRIIYIVEHLNEITINSNSPTCKTKFNFGDTVNQFNSENFTEFSVLVERIISLNLHTVSQIAKLDTSKKLLDDNYNRAMHYIKIVRARRESVKKTLVGDANKINHVWDNINNQPNVNLSNERFVKRRIRVLKRHMENIIDLDGKTTQSFQEYFCLLTAQEMKNYDQYFKSALNRVAQKIRAHKSMRSHLRQLLKEWELVHRLFSNAVRNSDEVHIPSWQTWVEGLIIKYARLKKDCLQINGKIDKEWHDKVVETLKEGQKLGLTVDFERI